MPGSGQHTAEQESRQADGFQGQLGEPAQGLKYLDEEMDEDQGPGDDPEPNTLGFRVFAEGNEDPHEHCEYKDGR